MEINSHNKRIPVNKPVEFVERLELLNSLPKNLDSFLQELSDLVVKHYDQQKRRETVRRKNNKRWLNGERLIKLTPEKQNALEHPYEDELRKLYKNFFDSLPDNLQSHLNEVSNNWLAGERLLNMLAVERESLELVVFLEKMDKNFQSDYQDWKKSQDSSKSEGEIFRRFCHEMKHNDTTREKYNAEKYQTKYPGTGWTTILPNFDEGLFLHRIQAGVERRGFKGFLTQLAVKDGALTVWAQGLMGIILRQQLIGSPPIIISRLRRCDFCLDKLVYAYTDKKRHCSGKCRSAASASRKRNGEASLLQKQLKKEQSRLERLLARPDKNAFLIKEQELRILEIQEQIDKR